MARVKYENEEMRHFRKALRVLNKYSVPVRAAFADKVARRHITPGDLSSEQDKKASGTKPDLGGATFS